MSASRLAPLLLCTLALACAKGDPLTGVGGAGGSGQGGDGASSSEGGSTTDNVTTSSTTSGPACDEQPCKLVAPQCGCEDGACTVDGAGSRICVEAGSAGQSEPCDETTLCEPGTICVGYTTELTSCATFCEDDSDCDAPGGKCAIDLTDAATVKLCSENCDFVTSQGCLLLGTACQLGITDTDQPFSLCAPSGAGTAQALCADTSECAPGFVCLPTTNDDNRCFQWCSVNTPACPADLPVCSGLDVTDGVPLMIGNVHYGVCNPA